MIETGRKKRWTEWVADAGCAGSFIFGLLVGIGGVTYIPARVESAIKGNQCSEAAFQKIKAEAGAMQAEVDQLHKFEKMMQTTKGRAEMIAYIANLEVEKQTDEK